jgi:hypothetical protein
MTTMEILEMTAKFAASIAVIFSAVALFVNTKAFKLQRRTLQASLFNDIMHRIDKLEDEHAEIKKGEAEKLERWYERIFNAYESFAFYANRGYLAKDMIDFFSSNVDYHVKGLEKFPQLFARYKNREVGEFCELKEYYRNVLRRNLPF